MARRRLPSDTPGFPAPGAQTRARRSGVSPRVPLGPVCKPRSGLGFSVNASRRELDSSTRSV
jgi:hypothetical protein